MDNSRGCVRPWSEHFSGSARVTSSSIFQPYENLHLRLCIENPRTYLRNNARRKTLLHFHDDNRSRENDQRNDYLMKPPSNDKDLDLIIRIYHLFI